MEILIFGILFIIVASVLRLVVGAFEHRRNILLIGLSALGILAFGIQYCISYVVHKIFKFLRLRFILLIFMISITIILTISLSLSGFEDVYESYSFSSLKFIIPSILMLMLTLKLKKFKVLKNISLESNVVSNKEDFIYVLIFTSILLNITSMFAFDIFDNNENLIYLEMLYYVATILFIFYGLLIIQDLLEIKYITLNMLNKNDVIRFNGLINPILEGHSSFIGYDDTVSFVEAILAKQLLDNNIFEIDVSDNYILMNQDIYQKKYDKLISRLINSQILTEYTISEIMESIFPEIHANEIKGYFENYLSDIGEYRYDSYGEKNFVLFSKKRHRICSSCGTVVYFERNSEELQNLEDEWYCSERCKETEEYCIKIRQKPYNKFITDASTHGLILMESGVAWNNNHTMTSPVGNNTHGYAAEKANNLFDKINRKKSKIIGMDNAKNGADRLVDGELIQTKYYSTARGTVESTFESGTYRYIDSNGKPMILEVPKDQYEQAVKLIAKKIENGQVPNVSDPAEAKNLVRQGSVTYNQAKNITKFGTFESVAYDLAEGTVVSISAAGISFGINVVIHYLNSKDKSQAIRAATVQAGKTFLTTMIVYAGSQQLHRVSLVGNVLSNINVNRLPRGLQNAITRGLGANSASSASKMLRGNIVASAVLIAVSTGPEFLKMVRGRISGAQFLHNTTVISSGIAGGGIGSFIGGVIGSPLGPAGVFGGKVVGGIVGGMVASFATGKVLGSIRKSDMEQMLELIQKQLEILSKTFMVTNEELDNINQNLSKCLSQHVLETMYSQVPEERLAYANYIIKPLFVMTIRQRDLLLIDKKDIVLALNSKAA